MLMSSVGFRSQKGCDDDARQKSTDLTSLVRRGGGGGPQQTRNCPKNNQRKNRKNWSRVPDGCLTPGRTGRLTVGRNVTLTSIENSEIFISLKKFVTHS
jgi:hypothetical protein